MISYSEVRASRTRSSSWSTPVAIACTGVVAMRSRPQEGQNFDFPVISLPQREQNMRASYAAVRLSQAETHGVSREGLQSAGRRGGGDAGRVNTVLSSCTTMLREKNGPSSLLPCLSHLNWH